MKIQALFLLLLTNCIGLAQPATIDKKAAFRLFREHSWEFCGQYDKVAVSDTLQLYSNLIGFRRAYLSDCGHVCAWDTDSTAHLKWTERFLASNGSELNAELVPRFRLTFRKRRHATHVYIYSARKKIFDFQLISQGSFVVPLGNHRLNYSYLKMVARRVPPKP